MAVNEVWVTVGMLYGLPGNAAHKQARHQTDALLAELVDRVGAQATGPRVIGGTLILHLRNSNSCKGSMT